MLLRDALLWIWRAVWMHRGRSLLTVVGFAIGIAAMVLLSSFGEGLRLFVLQQFTQFGSHIVGVSPGQNSTFGVGAILKTTRPLTLEDADAIERLPGIEAVVPAVAGLLPVEANNRTRNTDIYAVGALAAQAYKLDLAQGRFLPDEERSQARPFAVLGSDLKQEFFGDAPALGEDIRVGGSRFKIIGVLASKGEFLGQDLDKTLYIPVARGQQMFNRESLMGIDVFYSPSRSAEYVSQQITELLIRRHGFEDFTITTQDQMLDTMDNILNILKLAGGGLGAISLLVGGVGIATILMITVTERTQEVGLLRALGATRFQIRNLFLGEAVFLALLGAVCGIALIALLMLTARLLVPGLPIAMSPGIILIALIAATVIGALSGVRPAISATRLSPIDALRSE
ncbi:ABC transporter permease [Porticoccaceae bacterium LTM1]|nr:ABC transporter permease [Porticoccaceae bacterium LTM1]